MTIFYRHYINLTILKFKTVDHNISNKKLKKYQNILFENIKNQNETFKI